MIASVVVRLKHGVSLEDMRFASLMSDLKSEPRLELGQIAEYRCLPATLDCADEYEIHELTCWLQSLPEVEFVDVVFVYLEHESAASCSGDQHARSIRLPTRREGNDKPIENISNE